MKWIKKKRWVILTFIIKIDDFFFNLISPPPTNLVFLSKSDEASRNGFSDSQQVFFLFSFFFPRQIKSLADIITFDSPPSEYSYSIDIFTLVWTVSEWLFREVEGEFSEFPSITFPLNEKKPSLSRERGERSGWKVKPKRRERERERKVKRSLQHTREKQLLIITTERASSGDLDTTPKWPSLSLSLFFFSHLHILFFFSSPSFSTQMRNKNEREEMQPKCSAR
jgi:hypothetical protein